MITKKLVELVNTLSGLDHWDSMTMRAGDRLALDAVNTTLIVCEQGVAAVRSGVREHPIEKATLAVLPGGGSHELVAFSTCSLWINRLPGHERRIPSSDVYTCNLETLAAASGLIDTPLEVTSIPGYVVGILSRHTPVGQEWVPWLSLDKVVASSGHSANDGILLVVRNGSCSASEAEPNPVDVAIIGAGPAGLSVAANASAAGLTVAIYGQPMSFWKRSIVPLPLRSQPAGTTIDSPREGFRYLDFAKRKGLSDLPYVPFHAFLAYAQNFIDGHGLKFRRSVVTDLKRHGDIWAISTNTSTQLAKNVVVAVGLKGMERIPPSVSAWGGRYLLASELQSFEIFRSKNVVIVGSGQSALEIALEAARIPGSRVTLLSRGSNIVYRSIHSPGNAVYRVLFKKVDKVFRFLPIPLQDFLLRFLMKGTAEPSIEHKLISSKVQVLSKVEIKEVTGVAGEPIKIGLSDGSYLVADHLVLGTGYRYDVRRVPFLRHIVEIGALREAAGLPVLSRFAESSANGLFFAGMSALRLIGPQCQFVFGTKKVTPRIVSAIFEKIRQRHA